MISKSTTHGPARAGGRALLFGSLAVLGGVAFEASAGCSIIAQPAAQAQAEALSSTAAGSGSGDISVAIERAGADAGDVLMALLAGSTGVSAGAAETGSTLAGDLARLSRTLSSLSDQRARIPALMQRTERFIDLGEQLDEALAALRRNRVECREPGSSSRATRCRREFAELSGRVNALLGSMNALTVQIEADARRSRGSLEAALGDRLDGIVADVRRIRAASEQALREGTG